MARDLSAYLQDILEACNSIQDVMSEVSLEEYRSKLEESVPSMRRCFVPYRILAQSLIFETCLLMTMEQLMTMPFSDLSTQT